jgi:hypothetical protein
MEATMEINRVARLERSAFECADMAAKALDPRAKAVLTTAANVWLSLAKQRGYQGQIKQTGELVDQLDTAIIDRGPLEAQNPCSAFPRPPRHTQSTLAV